MVLLDMLQALLTIKDGLNCARLLYGDVKCKMKEVSKKPSNRLPQKSLPQFSLISSLSDIALLHSCNAKWNWAKNVTVSFLYICCRKGKSCRQISEGTWLRDWKDLFHKGNLKRFCHDYAVDLDRSSVFHFSLLESLWIASLHLSSINFIKHFLKCNSITSCFLTYPWSRVWVSFGFFRLFAGPK